MLQAFVNGVLIDWRVDLVADRLIFGLGRQLQQLRVFFLLELQITDESTGFGDIQPGCDSTPPVADAARLESARAIPKDAALDY